MCNESIDLELLRGTFAFWASGRSVWVKAYPSGGFGVGMNRTNGKGQTENVMRADYHKFGNNKHARPHIDIPGATKHWPWKK